MVDEIKAVETMKPRCLMEGRALPEQIVEPDPSLPLGRIPRILPRGEADPCKMQVRAGMFCQETFDVLTVYRMG